MPEIIGDQNECISHKESIFPWLPEGTYPANFPDNPHGLDKDRKRPYRYEDVYHPVVEESGKGKAKEESAVTENRYFRMEAVYPLPCGRCKSYFDDTIKIFIKHHFSRDFFEVEDAEKQVWKTPKKMESVLYDWLLVLALAFRQSANEVLAEKQYTEKKLWEKWCKDMDKLAEAATKHKKTRQWKKFEKPNYTPYNYKKCYFDIDGILISAIEMKKTLTSGQFPIFTEKDIPKEVLKNAKGNEKSVTMKNLSELFGLMKNKPWRYSNKPQYAKPEDRRPLLAQGLGSQSSSSSAGSSVSLSPYQSDDSGSSNKPSYKLDGSEKLPRNIPSWAEKWSSSEASSSGRSSRNSHGGSSGSGGSNHSHGGGSGSGRNGHGGSSGGGSSSRH